MCTVQDACAGQDSLSSVLTLLCGCLFDAQRKTSAESWVLLLCLEKTKKRYVSDVIHSSRCPRWLAHSDLVSLLSLQFSLSCLSGNRCSFTIGSCQKNIPAVTFCRFFLCGKHMVYM